MKKVLVTVVLILVLNLALGYIFQLANEVTCLTELSFLGLGGLFFWLLSYRPIKKMAIDLMEKKGLNRGSFLIFGAIGLVVTALNLFFCQFFVITSFAVIYGCIPPSSETITATLTNNITGNLLCYAALIGLVLKEYSSTQQQVPHPILSSPERKFIQLSHRGSMVRIHLKEICYVQVANNCITIHTAQRAYVKYQSLTSFQRELPGHQFKRVHRSTLVNLDFIQRIETNQSGDGDIVLRDGTRVRFSRNYKKDFQV